MKWIHSVWDCNNQSEIIFGILGQSQIRIAVIRTRWQKEQYFRDLLATLHSVRVNHGSSQCAQKLTIRFNCKFVSRVCFIRVGQLIKLHPRHRPFCRMTASPVFLEALSIIYESLPNIKSTEDAFMAIDHTVDDNRCFIGSSHLEYKCLSSGATETSNHHKKWNLGNVLSIHFIATATPRQLPAQGLWLKIGHRSFLCHSEVISEVTTAYSQRVRESGLGNVWFGPSNTGIALASPLINAIGFARIHLITQLRSKKHFNVAFSRVGNSTSHNTARWLSSDAIHQGQIHEWPRCSFPNRRKNTSQVKSLSCRHGSWQQWDPNVLNTCRLSTNLLLNSG